MVTIAAEKCAALYTPTYALPPWLHYLLVWRINAHYFSSAYDYWIARLSGSKTFKSHWHRYGKRENMTYGRALANKT